jgi:hypothetical protein
VLKRFFLAAALGVAAQLGVDTASAIPGSASRPAVVRSNEWHLRSSLSAGTADISFVYGLPGDIPLFGDWDGNGVRTPGVVRGNTWLLRNSNSTGNADIVFQFGLAGDTPIAGDWDGDGKDTPGVVRAGQWYLRDSTTTGSADDQFGFGAPADVPLVGDWDGDSDDNPGVARAGSCFDCFDYWFLRTENNTGDANIAPFVAASDKAVPGDWDGDGVSTAGWIDYATWRLYRSHTYSPNEGFEFGLASDRPLAW